eukprot:CAMPEP_0117542470 /NCGR_PEP_ID=MMETSP0784-20121206/44561_1 /TAXON_ID=39447 /ORGANISM="" /LENGTH=479 /DNA_ID=CAMNT_0005339217 /DNA_START=1 /DNA_END=1437 /DNA_ORIENTATION=-
MAPAADLPSPPGSPECDSSDDLGSHWFAFSHCTVGRDSTPDSPAADACVEARDDNDDGANDAETGALAFGAHMQAGGEVACAASASPCVVVTADTGDYRHLARILVTAQDTVVEVGSCMGFCTTILHARAGSVIGLDVSDEHLAKARSSFPDITFQFLDVFEEPDRLRDLPEAAGCTVAFLDIGGDRELSQVVLAIELLRRRSLPELRALVVKSEELHAAMVAAGCEGSAGIRGARRLLAPGAFLETWRHFRDLCAPTAHVLQRHGGIGSWNQRKKKQARCSRAAAAAASPPTSIVALPRGVIESSLPPGPEARSGFHRMKLTDGTWAATCFVLDEPCNPLLRRHEVACVYGDEAEATVLAQATRHCVPVFVGHGTKASMYEFLGSFSVERTLPRSHALYQNDALTTTLEVLCARSRRRLPEPWLLQLRRSEEEQVPREESAEPAGLSTLAPLLWHPAEAGGPEAWAEVIRGRAGAIAA